ncbi:MAG: right-handed parallel beta-helix repeat-containing protein [Fibrobacterota bacterium]|nr:right-handed parallel beta-helix repeat-containing protein [Fibrobacterota bacterium]QQS05312.1 MAG: right-handed parallel beta-helix repeat-containing protein [Fibrobacterota bacterium]
MKPSACFLVLWSMFACGPVRAEMAEKAPAPVADSANAKRFPDPKVLSKNVNVADFYSGESTYDAAFERAISYAAKRTSVVIPNKVSMVSGSVFVPAGTYPIRRSIVVREGVRLFGASKSASIIKWDGAGGPALIMGAPPLSPSGAEVAQTEFSNVAVEHLAVVGGKMAGSVGVKFAGCIRGSRIQDCQILNFGINVEGDGSYGFEISDNFIHDAVTNNLRWSSPTASTIQGNRIDDAGKEGILIDDRSGTEVIALTISNNIIQSCRRNALKVEDAVQATIEDNFFESNCLDEQGCAHVLFAPSSEVKPKKSLSITFQGNFFTPGPSSRHFPNKANNRSIEVRNSRAVSLVGVVARGFQQKDSATGSRSGVLLGSPANKLMRVDRVFSRGSLFNGSLSPAETSDSGTILDVR